VEEPEDIARYRDGLARAGRRGKRILGALGTTEAFVNWSDFLRRTWRQNRTLWERNLKTDSEVIGGVFVLVRRDPILGWRPTVVTAPKHTKNAQELADKIAAELRKKFTLKD
jgi:hypothetical protein